MLQPGDSFGDYRVIKLLGQGGMGSVFLLENGEGAQVAAKILDPATAGDHESRKRFLREAELALGVKHQNLVETYDVGEDPDTGLCYILMEYVPGGSLADKLRNGPLPVNEAIRIVYQIASVLELARQKGVVHRDIKPDNIMFGADGKAKLADLGIARGGVGGVGVTTVTQTGMMIGTPAYMAPEQMLDAHNVDSRADIYSLGIVFYEMLTGERPNKDDTVVQLMAKAVAGEPIPDVRTMRPEVSAAVAELISLMCAIKADERIATPVEVTTALSQIAHGREVTIVRKRPSAIARNPTKEVGDFSRRVVMAVFGLIAVVGVAAFAYFGSHGRPSAISSPMVAKTNVIEKVVEKVVERTRIVTNVVEKPLPAASPVVPSPVTTLAQPEPERFSKVAVGSLPERTRKRLVEIAARRRAGERRGVLAFGRLEIEDSNDFANVASWAWIERDGSFVTDVWPNGPGARGSRRRALTFLKQGYEPVTLDLSREADCDWDDRQALDLGTLTLRKSRPDDFRALRLRVVLPTGVTSGELRVFQENRTIVGFDWGTSNASQHPNVLVCMRSVASGDTMSVTNCGTGFYRVEVSAAGCATFKKRIDMSDPTLRDLGTVTLPKTRTATFALRHFAEKDWFRQAVTVDNDQSLRINHNGRQHILRLDPFEGRGGLGVSAFYQPSTYDDYGEMSVEQFERLEQSGGLAAPIGCKPTGGSVVFHVGHIYRFRNTHMPIDVLIRFDGLADTSSGDHTQIKTSRRRLSSLDAKTREAVELVRKRLGFRTKKGCLVVGNLRVEGDEDLTKVATWARIGENGVFVAGVHPGRSLCFIRHGCMPLILDVPETGGSSLDDDPFDLGRVTIRKLRNAEVQTAKFLIELPEGIDHAELTVRINVGDPAWEDWGSHGWERLGVEVLRRTVRHREVVKLDGLSPCKYSFSLTAHGCATYGGGFDAARQSDLGVIRLLRTRTAEFFVRNVTNPGGWVRRTVAVDGRNPLLLKEEKDRIGNTANLWLDPYEAPKGILATFGWSPTEYFDLGMVSHVTLDAELADGKRSLPSGAQPMMGQVAFLPGHIYHMRQKSHWNEEWLIEFASYNLSFDAARFADRDSTRRVQKTLDALFPGWKTTKNAAKGVHPNEEIGYISEICGRQDVLATLPPSRQNPVRLTRSIVVPANAKLSFAVRKNPTAGGGLMLEVYANGRRRWEGVVTDGEWFEHSVDLSDLAGKKARLEVRHLIHPDFGNARALWADLSVR